MPVEAAVGGGMVGARLREARVAANLTIEEVAHALKFSPRQIERLEADDYAALPGGTIVRGFVRNYARLLKLDADALLRELDAVLPGSTVEVRPPENMGVAVEPGERSGLSPALSALAALLLAALLLVLWHFFGPSSKPLVAAASRSEPTAAPVPGTVAPPATQPSGAEGGTPPPTPADPPAAAPEPQALPAHDAPVQGAVPALQFGFADRSWVEVVDADRRQLHSAENPAGSQLTLQGRPPFEIVIGNAGKVTLTYGERTIDLAPHTRAEVARLKVE